MSASTNYDEAPNELPSLNPSSFGIHLELWSQYKTGKELDPISDDICRCGHSSARHDQANKYLCSGSIALQCHCSKMVAQLRVSDSRYFFHETAGYGSAHAFSLGFDCMRDYNPDATWKVYGTPSCHVEKTHSKEVIPVSLDEHGYISLVPSKSDVFLCPLCVEFKLREYSPTKSSRPRPTIHYYHVPPFD